MNLFAIDLTSSVPLLSTRKKAVIGTCAALGRSPLDVSLNGTGAWEPEYIRSANGTYIQALGNALNIIDDMNICDKSHCEPRSNGRTLGIAMVHQSSTALKIHATNHKAREERDGFFFFRHEYAILYGICGHIAHTQSLVAKADCGQEVTVEVTALHFWQGSSQRENGEQLGPEANGCQQNTAEDSASKRAPSYMSILLLGWMNETLNAGNKHALQFEDLSPPLRADATSGLTDKISAEWAEQVRTTSRRSRNKRPQLWKALARVVPVRSYLALFGLRLLAAMTNVGLLMLTWFYLRSLSEPSGADVQSSSLYIAGIGITSLVKAMCVQHSDHQSDVWGIRLRTALIGVVYKKVSLEVRALTTIQTC